jgi:hypothetical protein
MKDSHEQTVRECKYICLVKHLLHRLVKHVYSLTVIKKMREQVPYDTTVNHFIHGRSLITCVWVTSVDPDQAAHPCDLI